MSDLVTHTDFVMVGTTDFEAACAFYGDTLGLERSKQWGEMPGMEFETGNLTLAVVESARFGIPCAPTTHPIAFRVDDVAAARAELEAKGVEFVGNPIDSGVCHMDTFRDPDGNVLMLHHRYVPETP